MNPRSGQAALEYMFTYGWAFLGIMVTLGVLAYFGIFDFTSLQQSDCSFTPGAFCEDFYIGNDLGEGAEVRMQLRNTFGADLTIFEATASDSTGTFGECYIPERVPDDPFSTTTYDWFQDTIFNMTCPFTAGYADGQSYDVTVTLNFTQLNHPYEHHVLGFIVGTAQ